MVTSSRAASGPAIHLGDAPDNGRALVTDDELQQAVKVAISTAQAEGADYITQTQRAVKMVLDLRPDMTADSALWFVKRVRK